MDEPPRLLLLTSDDRESQHRLRRGELVRVTHGAAVDRAVWQRASVRQRARIELEAVVTTVGEWRVLSHRSAALLWGLPDVDRPDHRVHVTDPLLGTTHSGRRVVRHAAALDDTEIALVEGRRVTSLVRTVVDLARSTSYENAVAVIDHVLREGLTDVDRLRRAFADWPTPRGMTRARRALRFADPLADSPGESVSRVRIDEDGFPPPVLQQQFGRFRVDFWWPRAGVVGEFDGFDKYDGVDAVRHEKHREQALLLRPEVRRVVRWGWAELRTPGRLQLVLRTAGLATGA
jgi:very-short-patch-repair endonuclease